MNRPALLAAAIASALALPSFAQAQTPAVPTPPT